MEKSTKPPSAIQSRVKLHHVCIGNANKEIDSRIFVNWEGLMKLSEIESAPTFLKMDIEGYEWDVLPNIISHVHRPLQIGIYIYIYIFNTN